MTKYRVEERRIWKDKNEEEDTWSFYGADGFDSETEASKYIAIQEKAWRNKLHESIDHIEYRITPFEYTPVHYFID